MIEQPNFDITDILANVPLTETWPNLTSDICYLRVYTHLDAAHDNVKACGIYTGQTNYPQGRDDEYRRLIDKLSGLFDLKVLVRYVVLSAKCHRGCLGAVVVPSLIICVGKVLSLERSCKDRVIVS